MKKRLKEKKMQWDLFMMQENAGMGTVEVILLIVVIFTIYMGCK